MIDNRHQLRSLMFKSRRLFRLYLVLVHLVLVMLVYETNLLPRLFARVSGDDIEKNHLYEALLPYHQRMDGSVPDGAIIFLGDSFVQALATSAVADRSVNYGIGADTIGGLLGRLSIYDSLSTARAIVILIGVNDLWYREHDEIVPLYDQLLAALPKNVPVIANALFPVADVAGMVSGTNARIVRLNKAMKKVAGRYPNIEYADNVQYFVDNKGQLKADLHIGDGLHLNANGYDTWIEILKNKLSRVTPLQVE